MTANAIFDYVLALMFSGENEKAEMEKQFISTLNIHLAELLEKEKGFRKEPLLVAPIITSITDKIDYDPRILAFIHWGIAGVMMAEDDPNIAAQYKNKYEEEKENCIVGEFVEVRNEV